jgi:3-methylcrotonyl-CoA carboxylase alpha subunit
VRHQLAIAAGEPLAITQDQILPRGHAIEVRLYAEDPAHEYLPSSGTLLVFDPPRAPGVRVDAGVAAGDDVSMYYDPILAKLIVHATDRPAALARLRWALDHFAVLGVTTNLPLLRAIAHDDAFAAGRTHTGFLAERGLAAIVPPAEAPRRVLLAAAAFEALGAPGAAPARGPWNPWTHGVGLAAGGERRARFRYAGREHVVTLTPVPGQARAYQAAVDGAPVGGIPAPPLVAHLHAGEITLRLGDRIATLRVARRADQVLVVDHGVTYALDKPRPPDVDAAAHSGSLAAGQQQLVAPMAGTIVKVNVAQGDHVAAQQTLVVLGAMKMEHAIVAPYPGRVRCVSHTIGDVVPGGEPLVEIEAATA